MSLWRPGHAYDARLSFRGHYWPLEVAFYHEFDLCLWLFVVSKGFGFSNPGSTSELNSRVRAVYVSLSSCRLRVARDKVCRLRVSKIFILTICKLWAKCYSADGSLASGQALTVGTTRAYQTWLFVVFPLFPTEWNSLGRKVVLWWVVGLHHSD